MHSTSDTGLQSDPVGQWLSMDSRAHRLPGKHCGYRLAQQTPGLLPGDSLVGKRQQQPLLSKDVNLLEKKRGSGVG